MKIEVENCGECFLEGYGVSGPRCNITKTASSYNDLPPDCPLLTDVIIFTCKGKEIKEEDL